MSGKRTRKRGGTSGLYNLGVSSFLFVRNGGVERGESTGAGTDYRSIRE